jgi:hypothetical protein
MDVVDGQSRCAVCGDVHQNDDTKTYVCEYTSANSFLDAIFYQCVCSQASFFPGVSLQIAVEAESILRSDCGDVCVEVACCMNVYIYIYIHIILIFMFQGVSLGVGWPA